VFKTRRQQTEETFHITFDESTEAIKFSKPSVDDIIIAELEIYPPDEYLHHFEPSQRYQVDSNVVNQNDQNDHSIQTNEILNDNQPKHSYHNNDEHIIDNLTNTKDVQITKPPSSLIEDASTPNAILIIQAVSPLSIPSIATPAPQDRWSREKHIELVNIVGNQRTGMLIREIGISINQENYVKDMLKKYDINGSLVKTPMVPLNNLGPGINGKVVNETQYMKGALSKALQLSLQLKLYILWMRSQLNNYDNILWMKSQLSDYDIVYEKVPIFCDNTSVIAISNNPVLHSRTKHIDIRYHFIRDHIIKGDIELHFILTQYQLDDIFTKPLEKPTFKRLIVELSMLNIDGSKPEPSNDLSNELKGLSMCQN
ncbi:hypothetical protein Tco_0927599, partial [Tanacetum coccineum]